MSRAATASVVCSSCGRTLRGWPTVSVGFYLSRHNGADGKPCRGSKSTRHRAAEVVKSS